MLGRFAQTDGDHTTAIPALTLHRRKAPSDPLHCIYNLGLGVVAQGNKQVLLGGESIDYGPGQSMLTTIDLPVISHVTRASTREPFLGMMLTLEARSVLQIASEMMNPGLGESMPIGPSRSKCSTEPCSIPPPARQAVGRASTGSPTGAADPSGDHGPPADRPRTARNSDTSSPPDPQASRLRRRSHGSSRTSTRR